MEHDFVILVLDKFPYGLVLVTTDNTVSLSDTKSADDADLLKLRLQITCMKDNGGYYNSRPIFTSINIARDINLRDQLVPTVKA